MLVRIDDLDAVIAELSAQIAARLAPNEALVLLDTIPGAGRQMAETLLAEIGPDFGQVPDADHPASLAGMAPGNHHCAGTRTRGKTPKSSRWL
jgi:transposase